MIPKGTPDVSLVSIKRTDEFATDEVTILSRCPDCGSPMQFRVHCNPFINTRTFAVIPTECPLCKFGGVVHLNLEQP
jgi:hypothetical protein